MAVQRRLSLYERGSTTANASGRHRRDICPVNSHRLAARPRIEVEQLSDEYPIALLDEDFDDLSCEPGRLLQLANQS